MPKRAPIYQPARVDTINRSCSNKSLAHYSKLWQTNSTGRNRGRQSWRGTHCPDRHFPKCRKVGQGIPRSGLPAWAGRCSNKSLAFYSKLWQTNPTGRNRGRQSWRGTHCADRHFPKCRKAGQGITRSGLPACGGLARLWRASQTMSKGRARQTIGVTPLLKNSHRMIDLLCLKKRTIGRVATTNRSRLRNSAIVHFPLNRDKPCEQAAQRVSQ